MTPELERMAQLLGMLGSDFDGEVLVAARKAHTMLISQDWTWQQLLANGSSSVLTEEQIQKIYSAGMQRGEVLGYQRGQADAAATAPQGPNPRAEIGDDLSWAEAVLEAAAKAAADGLLTDNEDNFTSDRRAAIRRYGRAAYLSQRQFDWLKQIERSLRRRGYL
jgi:hypothetical protein